MNNTTKTIMATIIITGHACVLGVHSTGSIPVLRLSQGSPSLSELAPMDDREKEESTAAMQPSIPLIEFKLGISEFNPNETRDYSTIIFGRHFPTDANKAKRANGDTGIVSGDSLDPEALVAWQAIALRFRFSLIMSAITERHYATARALAEKSTQSCMRMSCFDEQNLGILNGKEEKEILSSPEFKEMLKNPDYKIPGGETGKEVIERFKLGIIFILKQLGFYAPKDRLAYVCTSRCSMNWLLRYLLKDFSFFQPNIPNCGMFIVRYFPEAFELQLCNRGAILPKSISELSCILTKYKIDLSTEAKRWEKEYKVSPRCKTPVYEDSAKRRLGGFLSIDTTHVREDTGLPSLPVEATPVYEDFAGERLFSPPLPVGTTSMRDSLSGSRALSSLRDSTDSIVFPA